MIKDTFLRPFGKTATVSAQSPLAIRFHVDFVCKRSERRQQDNCHLADKDVRGKSNNPSERRVSKIN
jgi:hypothetical protein